MSEFSAHFTPQPDAFRNWLYKGKDKILDHGSYRGLKLTKQVMKLLELALESYIREMGNIDEMQLYIAANKLLYFAFIYLEKVLNVQRRSDGGPAWASRSRNGAVCVIQGMYSNARSRVWMNCQYSEELAWELVCIRVLSLAHSFSSWCWRRFHVSSALMCHGIFSMLIMTWCLSWTPLRSVFKHKAWKAGMESKGLRGDMKKAKFLVSGAGHYVIKKSGKYPCAVCGSAMLWYAVWNVTTLT